MLWREVPFVERFQRAADAGFAAAEFLWPRGENLDALVRAKERAGVQVALFNVDGGDIAAGDRGYMNDRGRWKEWRNAFAVALDLAKRLGCPRLNCLVGNDLGNLPRVEQMNTVRDNFTWALWHADPASVRLMIEPLNAFETPRYLLTHTADALAFIESLRDSTRRDPELLSPTSLTSIRAALPMLQYDIYHMQRMEGNLIATIRKYGARFGHVQIADSPDRHQPGTGEIAWKRVLGTLEEIGYDGYVGLEYNPLGTTEESLAWLPRDKRRGCRAEELNFP